jgi:arylformamidase
VVAVAVHDISAGLRADLPTWPGEQGLRREITARQPEDPATVSHLAMSAHAGTHVDAPIHFLPGAAGIDAYSPEVFVGPAYVCDLRAVESTITADDLARAGMPDDVDRIVGLTRNSGWSREETAFREDYVAYDMTAAEWCLERGIRLVGIDYLSVEAFGADEKGHPVHRALLGAGIAILEGLDLAGIEPGTYDLAALPLLVPGSDGAPARAVLIDR